MQAQLQFSYIWKFSNKNQHSGLHTFQASNCWFSKDKSSSETPTHLPPSKCFQNIYSLRGINKFVRKSIPHLIAVLAKHQFWCKRKKMGKSCKGLWDKPLFWRVIQFNFTHLAIHEWSQFYISNDSEIDAFFLIVLFMVSV